MHSDNIHLSITWTAAKRVFPSENSYNNYIIGKDDVNNTLKTTPSIGKRPRQFVKPIRNKVFWQSSYFYKAPISTAK